MLGLTRPCSATLGLRSPAGSSCCVHATHHGPSLGSDWRSSGDARRTFFKASQGAVSPSAAPCVQLSSSSSALHLLQPHRVFSSSPTMARAAPQHGHNFAPDDKRAPWNLRRQDKWGRTSIMYDYWVCSASRRGRAAAENYSSSVARWVRRLYECFQFRPTLCDLTCWYSRFARSRSVNT